ncbi:MlaE family ABC transporter permease [Undibacterium oligocarboniphilum]|uniref:ABC transporter permease n=1 Tax=Undibacterium oligocarboniphilum TaxID=666702 RepID=A0A850QSW3_9BURK|nr:ABC transporter permease [Undibacterium oligocarboniphilum]MBC3871695.1 ABC transporter permease [Undibacterium oligocarboniphilum]NVO79116.1 ABC transporter permease [Undibacterium oligocarboniphilum]
MRSVTSPTLRISQSSPATVTISGDWTVHALTDGHCLHNLHAELLSCQQRSDPIWDLCGVNALDHTGAQVLWHAWQCRRPAQLRVHANHQGIFERLEQVSQRPLPKPPKQRLNSIMQLGMVMLGFFSHARDLLTLLGQLIFDLGRFLRHPLRGPWKELSANLYRMGAQALGITALVGILIGIVLSYLSAQQLRTFGGDLFIVNILGMSIIRELGPMLAAILVAGRSGSAITAQLGVMRVTEELDAMRVMGIPHGFRLIMPKVLALALAMPLLVIWTDVMALIGGMISAQALLGMTPEFFVYKLPEAVPLLNYWIGLGKGVTFGILIALIACHFGLRIEPNTESLGRGTTGSVVIAITVVIIADAVFAIIFSKVGY